MSRVEQIAERLRNTAPARWLALRERNEQRIIVGLGLVTLVTVLWLGVWKPISDWRTVEHNRYSNAQATLDWMRANEARARERARASATQSQDRSLIPLITRAAEAQGLQLTRLQPEASGAVSVVLQGQPFNDVVRWLHQLEENNGIAVTRVAFDADARPGFVNAQVRLQ
ncbi:MAG: type II secretion system protein M [Pseudomonadales bacterium]|nr:type II secretion system protein M [Pseudomonadales bacterium]